MSIGAAMNAPWITGFIERHQPGTPISAQHPIGPFTRPINQLMNSNFFSRCGFFGVLYSRLCSGALLVFLIAGLSACGEKDEGENEMSAITVGITGTFLGEAATYMAEEKGFFEEHGLQVTLKRNPSGGDSIREMFREDVDIAHVAETPVVASWIDPAYIEKQPVPPFQIFANMINAFEIQGIIARKDHGIDGPADIAGKRIAVYKGTQLDYYLGSFLLENQISRDELDLVDMHPAEHNVNLSIREAVPCALIVNELVLNALKHGLHGFESGTIRIALKEKEGEVYLSVGDDGNGLPENFDISRTGSFGFQIVNTLLGQLDATIETHSDSGSVFRIRFRKNS